MTTEERYTLAAEQVLYDPKSGKFTWNVDMPHRGIKVGDVIQGFAPTTGSPRVRIGCKSLALSKLAWYLVHVEIPRLIRHIDGNFNNMSLNNLERLS